ncbi:hypothetical protein FE257_003598 [Aspergillus nanangensis]|uniref:Uncharacterized protein n=1 Tax=Aspergillus nanangensis TaxID=2582783 RepID=A0AAD4CTR6_ASPNN|nr:hypothetical protein FE257_003598 [Aspergillus nanangensis]
MSRHSFCILFLSFVISLICPHAVAAPWIVTDAYEQAIITDSDYYYGSTVVTTIQEILPTATSLPDAFSTITSISTADYYYDDDVTVIQKLYPTGVGKPNGRYHYYYDEDGLLISDLHTTMFMVQLTYTAPTGCSSQWTQTTAVEVTPPAMAQNLLPRTSTKTSVSVDSSLPFQPTTYTYDVVYVDPTQLPSSTLASISDSNIPTNMYTGEGCSYTGSSSSGYRYSGDYYDYHYDNWFMDGPYYAGLTLFGITLICSIGWIGLFVILGFIESWVRFRRLMTGWQTRRGLPVCWALTIIPITLLLLFCFKKGYRARSDADAEALKARWKAMSIWTKLKLFFIWGFRYRYPPMLGPAPARVATSKQPSKNPGPRLLETTPAQSVAPGSRRVSGEPTPPHGDGLPMAETSMPTASRSVSAPQQGENGRS